MYISLLPYSVDSVQFSAASEQELVQLETLADLAERLLDHLRDTYIPQAEAQSELIHRAVSLLAYEASLRFEQIQRQWLADYQQRSTL
ncbi:hypothetical protein FGIG_09283 [Fasciola gigantica]|uniref:Uncharacterized protein n=1 Tax=Fasciola gigantica TaxID=46835 RepID=A0A504YP19_FASGI|nr:hypothetical protein FGIG_09283 [Fasciola gigantica]